MTRIENLSPLEERDVLKKEIRQELRGDDRRKKLRSCGGCLAVVLVVLGIPAFLLALLAARTGFFNVPLLSKIAYAPSSPTREVRPFMGETADQVLHTLPLKGTYDTTNFQFRLPVSEQELTTVAQGQMQAHPNMLPFPVNRVQFAIEPDMIELFAVSPQEGRDATVRLRFVLTVHDGVIAAQAIDLMLGNQPVPKAIAQAMLDAFGKGAFDAVRAPFDQVGRLTEVSLGKGVMTFVFLRQ